MEKYTGHTIDIRTVCECNRRLGKKTRHPQAALISIENDCIWEDAVTFEFYAVLLIERCPDGSYCGRKFCDFSNATMLFLRPGEVFRLTKEKAFPDKGWLLAFHPDLLFSTSLKADIADYSFFSYHKEEALHLSQKETGTVTCCLENIEEELHHPVDSHTATILSRHIQLLLDYCSRFYERQFITREDRNKSVVEQLGGLMDDYISSGRLINGGFPTAQYLADHIGMSPAYLADMLKYETGKGLDEFFSQKRLKAAKRMLHDHRILPAAIAAKLGFSSVQQFNMVFKRVTGMSPGQYRASEEVRRS